MYYSRFSPTISYIVKDKNLKSNKRLFFQLKNISINKQLEFNEKENSITSLSILKSNINADKSKSLLFNSQLGNSFLKTSLTYSFRKFYKAFRQYNFRLFIGKFIEIIPKTTHMTLVLHQYPIIPTVLIYLGVPKMKGFFPNSILKMMQDSNLK